MQIVSQNVPAVLKCHVVSRLVGTLRFLLQDWRFRAAVSLAFAAFLMFFMSLQDRFSFTDDDWAISVVLSGRYPDSGLCLFVNAVVSHICLALNEAFPALNWFIFLEGVVTFVAFAAFTYAMLTYVTPLVAFIGIAAVQYFMLPSCTYLANFTFIAALCSLSGASLLLGRLTLGADKKCFPSAVLGIFLCIAGFCLRREAFYLGLPFFFIVLVLSFINSEQKKILFKRCVPILILFAACGALYAYDLWAWSSPEWAEWSTYNSLRAQMSDYGMPPYDEVADKLSAAGINEYAYALALNWGTGISDFYSMERMEVLASLSGRWNMESVIGAFVAYPLSITLKSRIVLFFVAAAFGSFLLARKWGKIAIFIATFVAYTACCYFFGLGRLIDRVEVPIYMYAFLCCAFAVGRTWHLPFVKAENAKILRFSLIFASVGCTLVLALTIHMMQHLLAHFEPEQALYSVDQENYTPTSDALYNFSMEPGLTNVWATNSYVVLEAAYDHRFLPSKEFLRKNICMGGWGSNAPFTLALDKEVGLEDMAEGMVNNPNVRFITYEKGVAQIVLGFIQSYYYPDAKLYVIDILYEPGSESVFYSYEIRSSSGKKIS